MEVFDMYFASLVGITLHPGYNRDNAEPLTLEDCADKAAEMMEIRKKYTGEK